MAMGFDQGWAIGAPCFFNDEDKGWIVGEVEKVVGVGRQATLTIVAEGGAIRATREAHEIEAASKRALEGVDDMVQLDELTEATVLSTLRARYERKDIYTTITPWRHTAFEARDKDDIKERGRSAFRL